MFGRNFLVNEKTGESLIYFLGYVLVSAAMLQKKLKSK
jgi:hypothetical protein